jgi:16S rRNA pseudouridine516 synthase
LLANLGYGSRAEIRAALAEGRVSVGGVPEKNAARKVCARDVMLDGQTLDHPDGICIILHKPAGYACSHDPREAPLIYDLLPPRWMRRSPKLSSVGRLDRDTTGLIIITDNTELIHDLTSPKRAIPKVYIIETDPAGAELDERLIPLFASGSLRITEKDTEEPCLPAELTITGKRSAHLVLYEGRYHQVKRMFAACGYHVCALHRESLGSWTLEGLEPGTYTDAHNTP